MSIFNKLFKNKQNQSNDPMFDVIYNYFANGSDDFDVDDKGVINISSDLYAIISKIANDIGSKQIFSTNKYVADLLNGKINSYMNSHDWKVATMQNLLLYGDSFSLIETGDKGTIQSITLLPTYRITVIQTAAGLKYRLDNNQTFTSDQILHFKLNSLNGMTGTSPLLALKNILKLSRSSNDLLRYYYKNTAFNKTLLKVSDNLSSADKKRLKSAFESNLGTDNAGGTIISDNNLDIEPFNTTAVDSSILKESKNNDYFSKKIAAVYHIPSNVLGVINPHSNSSDVMNQYREALKPYENILTSELGTKINGDYQIKDNITPVSAADVANLAKAGAITPQQAQQFMGII